jgi:hypothetical protein
MKKINRKNMIKGFQYSTLALALGALVVSTVPSTNAYAAENNQDTSTQGTVKQGGMTLSTDSITLTEGGVQTFTVALPSGYDASGLIGICANPEVASIEPIAAVGNIAAFSVGYVGTGSTVAAVYSEAYPSMVAYLTVDSSMIIMDIPSKLGTNKDNYCSLVSYEFVPYDYTYEDFNDYKYTLNLKYKCSSYNDTDFTKWGCYGYFYDASGNIIKKVHLYASSLAKDREYHSEFNVPVNAVKFSIEGVS